MEPAGSVSRRSSGPIHPRPTLGRRLDRAARASLPGGSTALLMLAATAPWGLPMQAALLPAATLGCVWFWTLRGPSAMPPVLVFALGGLWDLLGFLPLGVGVLTALITGGVAARARAALGSGRLVLTWAVFAVVALGAAPLDWAVISGLQWRALPFLPLVFQWALTVAVYPALSALLAAAAGGAWVADPEQP